MTATPPGPDVEQRQGRTTGAEAGQASTGGVGPSGDSSAASQRGEPGPASGAAYTLNPDQVDSDEYGGMADSPQQL